MFDSALRPFGLLLLAFLLFGCDDKPPPIPLDGGRRDAGTRDGGARADASHPDIDGGPDASSPVDAGAPTCTADPEHVFKLGTDSSGDRTVGLAAGGAQFGLAWTQTPPAGAVPEVYGARLSSAGVLDPAQQITVPPGRKHPPAVAAFGSAWVAAWVDNASGTFELRTSGLASDLSVPVGSTARSLTDTPTALEDTPTLFETSTGLLLAWVEDDETARTRIARAVTIDGSGAATGATQAASSASHAPVSLALGELTGGPVLVYSASVDLIVHQVFVQGLTPTGATRGTPTPITEEGNSDGTVDAALLPSGGAVVFGALVSGVRKEVHFRAFDGAGNPIGDERVLGAGTDASIARFAGGYAVSYRASQTSTSPPEIHLLLVSAVGDVVAELPVLQSASSGGRTTVRVSGDGQIAITWGDRTDSGTDMRVAHVACGIGG